MDKEYFFNLINAVYEVTELFPKEEPLRFEIRKRSLKVFADLMISSPNPGIKKIEDLALLMIKDIEIIEEFLNLAESQEMADSRNFLVLEREYGKIKDYLEEKLENSNSKEILKKNPEEPLENNFFDGNGKNHSLTSRQQKIVRILKDKKTAQPGDILNSFDEVTKRTLRRDLGRLSDMGIIKRVGKSNKIFYKISE